MVEQRKSGAVRWNSVAQCYGKVEQYGGTMIQFGTVWNNVVEHCGTVWWNSKTVWHSRGTVEQYGGNSAVQQWNSVKQCGGTVWNSMLEQ